MTHYRFQFGLSLVELMVALLLGVVLSFGAVNLFMQSKFSFLQDEQTARMQEGGRYAQRYIARELGMAGFYGGVLRGADINSNLVSGANNCYDWLADTSRFVEHRNNVDSVGTTATAQTLPSACLSATDSLVPNTDVLLVRRVTDDTQYLRDETATVTGSATFDAARVYLRLEDYNVSTTLETGNNVGTAGSMPLSVWPYRAQLLFVRDWSVTVGDGVPALCRKEMSGGVMGPTTCLVEGVENLQVEFGIDTDDDYIPDQYLDAPNQAQLSLAMSARIFILMRSTNALAGYTNDKAYNLGSTPVAAQNDGLYRRVYQTSTLLRNSEALGI
ncbi:PilW family protein [Seongchinamella sediminis]|nr:PilW family protein [Seongchinamella sediminis]